ncbi:MAG: DUF4382 domain-containing protein [Fidelibacterota bacterium]|nr:MAG: DUF4382 domain-containing protein [Candidatus Neomarinimicrobiota bacterium]
MKIIVRYLKTLIVLITSGVMLLSCESATDSDSDDGETSNLLVLLSDAPFPADTVAEAIVVIDSMDIRAKGDGEGDGPFITLSRERGAYDLMDLRNGVTASLVDLDVPVGRYDLVRLFVDSAYIFLKEDETSYPLRVPGGSSAGFKVFIRPEIEVISGITSELLIDIDVSKSLLVQRVGQSPNTELRFTFKPVIRAVNYSSTGRITGEVKDTSSTPVLIRDAQVSVYQDTLITSTFTDTTGAYALIGLEAGSYSMIAYATGYDSLEIENVEVVAATETPQDFVLTPVPEE